MINQAPLFRKIFVSLLFLVSGIPKSSTRTLHGNFVPSERTLYGNFLPEQTGKCRLTLLSLNVKMFNSFVGYSKGPNKHMGPNNSTGWKLLENQQTYGSK